MKTIIFDFDGTLSTNSYELVIQYTNRLSEKYGHDKIIDIEKLRTKSYGQIIKEDLKLNPSSFAEFMVDIKNILENNTKDIKLYSDLINKLESISENFSFIILSSNNKNIIEEVLERNNTKIFKEIYSDPTLFGKDKIINNIVSKYGLDKNDVIYVGDEIRDMEACKKAGVKIISVTWGFNNKETLIKLSPDYIADNSDELIEIINNI